MGSGPGFQRPVIVIQCDALNPSSEPLRHDSPSCSALATLRYYSSKVWNTFAGKPARSLSHDPLQGGQGSSTECCSWPVAASYCAPRSSASVVTRVRLVRAPGISLPARSFPTRSTNRSSRSHCANHLEASTANRGTAAEIREKQWPDHWIDRSQRSKRISARSTKAWLSRVKIAANFKFRFLCQRRCKNPRSSG